MKLRALILIAVLNLPLLAQAPVPEKMQTTKAMPITAADFRQASWGMSRAEVKKVETSGAPVIEESALVGYNGKAGEFDALIGYIFVQDKLVRARYRITTEHTNRTDYVSDFKTLRETLQAKYGKPKTDEVVWKKDLYKDDPSDWGMAVAVGHMVMMASWETPETNIYLFLRGDNYEINLDLEYASTKLKGLAAAEAEKKQSSDF